MNKRQGNRVQALRAVEGFLADNSAALPTVANSGSRRKFDRLMADIKRHIADQSGAELTAKIKTKKIHALRRALVRDQMKPIARIAAAELPDRPELYPLRLPRGTPSLQRLIAYARGMAKLAKTHADVFIDEGLPHDFLARFADATKAVGQAATERMSARGARSGATKGLETQLGRARKEVGVLDAFISTALQDDAALLTNWKTIKRVPRGTRPTTAAPTT